MTKCNLGYDLFTPPMITVHTVPALLAALPSYAATLLAASIC